MELTKKTTILFPPSLFEHLVRTAKRRKASLGQLVREACEARYGAVTEDERLAAVARLRSLSLPVSTPRRMKRESVPAARDTPR